MDTALDVLPDMFGFVPAMTQCDCCGCIVPLNAAVVTTHHITAYITEVEHYCSDAHALYGWRKRAGILRRNAKPATIKRKPVRK